MSVSILFLLVEVLNQLLKGFPETEPPMGFSLELFAFFCN